MNNLLRTLTETQGKSFASDVDLRLLLTTVKEGRRQAYDAKLTDPFYDSLEGLLLDLRTVTIDNHDAEAFLKPVSKIDVPDYYEVIQHPMDLQTMLKKVKSKAYKSKHEFKDDLDLIWSNCLTYNATENHPLRQCATRLRQRADRLLAHITDRKERLEPPLPSEFNNVHVARPRVNGNGMVNGRTYSHTRSPSLSLTSKVGTPSFKSTTPVPSFKKGARYGVDFPDTPAIVRTPEGMALFAQLDREVAQELDEALSLRPYPSRDTRPLDERLQELAFPLDSATQDSIEDHLTVDGMVGDKRKLNGIADHRPRKKARFSTPLVTSGKDEICELWWAATESDALLGNGFPGMPHLPSSSASAPQLLPPPDRKPRSKPKRRKKLEEENSKALLSIMNNNIKTMRRVRHTHAKFAALNLTNSTNDDPENSGFMAEANPALPPVGQSIVAMEEDAVGVMDDKVDERPWLDKFKRRPAGGIELGERNAADCLQWMGGKILEHAGFQGSSRVALDVLVGVTSEYLLNVGRTIKFLCDKYAGVMTAEEIVLHTLFESGISQIQDLERYVHDDVERQGSRLSDLERKLVSAYRESTSAETLDEDGIFDEEDDEEAGVLTMGDFADMLGEDYLGFRELGIAAEFGMSSLTIPKKLLKGKRGFNKSSSTAAKPKEPPPPYPPPPPFVPLTSAQVDDQIGLLKPYYLGRFNALLQASTPPPAPPSLPGPSLAPPVGANPTIVGPPAAPSDVSQAQGMPLSAPVAAPSSEPVPKVEMSSSPPPLKSMQLLTLPDDPPNPAQVKMSPLGQIIKAAPSGTTSKKKKAPGAGASGASGGGTAGGAGGSAGPSGGGTVAPALSMAGSAAPGAGGIGSDASVPPKKKKGPTGVGTGNGRKKKMAEGIVPFPSGVGHGLAMASPHQEQPGHVPQPQVFVPPPLVAQ